MKLFFICPDTGEGFTTERYSLQRGHRVVVDHRGGKTLQGTVVLDAGCPFCGVKHEFTPDGIGCPLGEQRDER